MQAKPMFTPVAGTTVTGDRFWYTGKAGRDFVSDSPKDAFTGLSLEGARRKAATLNRMELMHGIHFMAITGDLAAEVTA